MALPKVKKGDIFTINLTHGVGFIQCVEESNENKLEVIRVIPGIYDEISSIGLEVIVSKKENFFVQFHLTYALQKKLVSFIENCVIPIGSEAPQYYRTKHIVRKDFLGWHIVERDPRKFRLVQQLSAEELLLSSWGIISFPDLVERIENNWLPEDWN